MVRKAGKTSKEGKNNRRITRESESHSLAPHQHPKVTIIWLPKDFHLSAIFLLRHSVPRYWSYHHDLQLKESLFLPLAVGKCGESCSSLRREITVAGIQSMKSKRIFLNKHYYSQKLNFIVLKIPLALQGAYGIQKVVAVALPRSM